MLNRHSPICVCLQETLLNPDHTHHAPAQYNIVHSNRARQDGHERGAAILIHKRFNYDRLQLQTNLQAVAVSLYLDRKYTVCSLYLPHHPVSQNQIDSLIRELPQPFLLLGDVNARSTFWGSDTTDSRGRLIENSIINNPISVLNNGEPTHYHIQTNSYSTIDLSLSSSCIADNFDYSIDDSLWSSDHYPIKIEWRQIPIIVSAQPRFKVKCAKWKEFTTLTESQF